MKKALADVHTKFPLHDLAAVRLDRIVRTTRGIALVFVNRQASSTGPERHTTVPTTYKITSALGFVPIKAFSAQKCGGTTSSEDAHDPLPEEMFSVGQGGSILPRENKGKTRVRKAASALEQKELFTANKKMKATNPQQNSPNSSKKDNDNYKKGNWVWLKPTKEAKERFWLAVIVSRGRGPNKGKYKMRWAETDKDFGTYKISGNPEWQFAESTQELVHVVEETNGWTVTEESRRVVEEYLREWELR